VALLRMHERNKRTGYSPKNLALSQLLKTKRGAPT